MKKSAPATAPSSTPTTGEGAPLASEPVPYSRHVMYFGLALAGCAADLVSKELAFRWRGLPGEKDPWWLVENRLGVQTSLNPGALFGMGDGWRLVFAGLACAAILGILVWLFGYRAARDRLLTFALGCITGGILGNLYDRLGLWHWGGLPKGVNPKFAGAVRDWILFEWREMPLKIFNPWPNFNIADSLLVCGACMLVGHAFLYREPAAAPKNAAE